MGRARRSIVACLISLGVLALAACSGVEGTGQSGSVPAGQAHGTDELQAVLRKFGESRENAKVISDQQLRDSIPAAQAWLQELEVNPEECGLTITGPLSEQLEHASMSALQLDASFITLASYEDAAQVAQNFADQEQRNERCARYTVLKDGRHVAFHMARQPVQTEAGKTAAHVLTSSDGATASQQLMIQAADGNIMITINQPLQKDNQSGQLAELAGQVDQLLELIR